MQPSCVCLRKRIREQHYLPRSMRLMNRGTSEHSRSAPQAFLVFQVHHFLTGFHERSWLCLPGRTDSSAVTGLYGLRTPWAIIFDLFVVRSRCLPTELGGHGRKDVRKSFMPTSISWFLGTSRGIRIVASLALSTG